MSDAITAALARIAALESEVSRSRKPEKEHPQFNADAFRQAMTTDPVGMLTKLGVPVDFVTKVFVAHALGDQAPPELKALAAMGPQVSHAQALDSKVDALSRQLSAISESDKKKGTRESFKALTADKTKYPNLAKALQRDPDIFNDELDAGGSAEEIATKLEARAKIFAPPPASEENADTTPDQSAQVKPATTAGHVPALSTKTGVFTEDEHTKLRDEIVRKYSSPVKDPA